MLDYAFEPVQPEARLFIHPKLRRAPAAFVARDVLFARDSQSTETTPLADVWSRLASGNLQVLDSFHDGERHHLLLRDRLQALPEPAMQRSVDILRRTLIAGCENFVCVDLGLSPATVASRARRALRWMGLPCHVIAAPYLLSAAAIAFSESLDVRARAVDGRQGGERWLNISLPRPELGLAGRLSPALFHVLCCFVAGKRRRLIALERGTSERTVANQLAVGFSALRASSRLDVLRLLAERDFNRRETPAGRYRSDGTSGGSGPEPCPSLERPR